MNRRFILRYMIYGIIIILLFQFIVIFDLFPSFDTSLRLFDSKNETIKNHCKLDNKQVKSALKRIKTEDCRWKVIQNYCDVRENIPWKESLSTNCPNHDFELRKHPLGCLPHKDEYLNDKSQKKKKTTKLFLNQSLSICLDDCFQYDFQYLYFHNFTCLCSNEKNFPDLLQFDCDYEHEFSMIQAYSTGLKKSFYIPDLPSSSPIVKNVKIAFLLQFNGRSYLQVNRLLKNIYRKQHYYYIHVDSRQNYLYNKLLPLEDRYPNIILSRTRYASIWGGSSLLTMMFTCMKDILNLWNDWDFILNLSETDFPLKTMDVLEQYLSENIGKNFVRSHSKNAYDFVFSQGMTKLFYECEQHLWRIDNRRLIKGLVMDGGSDWFVLDRKFIEFVIVPESKNQSFKNEDRTDIEILESLKNFYKYSLLPGESFFHILIRNSRFCTTMINSNLRITNWNRLKGCHCQHKNVVDWCGCSPNTFRITDHERLSTTLVKPLFFGRKFEHSIDQKIIKIVEKEFLNINEQSNEMEESVYLENIYNEEYDLKISSEMEHFLGELKEFIFHRLPISQGDRLLIEDFTKKSGFVDVYRYFNCQHSCDCFLFKYGNFAQIIVCQSFNSLFRVLEDDSSLRMIKVCDGFDVKEEIFRDLSCLFEKSIQILHEWKNETVIREVAFVFLNDRNSVQLVKTQSINGTKHLLVLDSDEFTLVKRQAGIWKMITFDPSQALRPLSISKFIVYGDKDRNSSEQRLDVEAGKETIITNIDHLYNGINGTLIEKNILEEFFINNHEMLSTKFDDIWMLHKLCTGDYGFEDKDYQSLLEKFSVFDRCKDVYWSTENVENNYLLL